MNLLKYSVHMLMYMVTVLSWCGLGGGGGEVKVVVGDF